MKQLAARTALVTGASRGLGVHIADALAREGMKLVIAARGASELDKVRHDLEARGTHVLAIPTDVADTEQLDRLVEQAEACFGGVDVLVNNAGIEEHRRFVHSSVSEMERTLRINLLAPMRLTHALLPRMLARGRGHIVNIASLAGLAGSPYGEAYSASKHGLVGFTRSLRSTQLAEGYPVGASVICPGFISDTGMYHEMQRAAGVRARGHFRPATPEDVGRAVVRAIRDEVPEIYVNGQPLRPLIALAYLFPQAIEWYGKRTGLLELFRQVVDRRDPS